MSVSVGSGTKPLQLPISERLLPTSRSAEGTPGSFTELLTQGVQQVNTAQQSATSQVHELVTGGDVSQVEVMTAVQKADMAFRLLVQIRNKLVSAYDQINAIRI